MQMNQRPSQRDQTGTTGEMSLAEADAPVLTDRRYNDKSSVQHF